MSAPCGTARRSGAKPTGGAPGLVRAAALALLVGAFAATASHAVTPTARHARLPEKSPAWSAVTFPSLRDSVTLHGWWFPGDGKGPVLVMFSRDDSTMASLLPAVKEFASRGFSVLTWDYRDFAPGAPAAPDTLANVIFASRWVDDAVGALRWARGKAGGRPVFGWGQGLGSVVAVAAAARPGRTVDAIAVEGLWRTAQEQIRLNGTSQIPGVQARHRVLVRGNDEPISTVPMLQVPLFVVIAARDEVTPPATTREVTRRSASLIEQYFVDDAGHTGAERTPGYFDAVSGWFRGLERQMHPGSN